MPTKKTLQDTLSAFEFLLPEALIALFRFSTGCPYLESPSNIGCVNASFNQW